MTPCLEARATTAPGWSTGLQSNFDTYLRFVEAVARVDIADSGGSKRPTELLGGGVTESAAMAVTQGAIDGVMEVLGFGDTRR